MFRVEYNVETGARREIEQTAYRNTSDPSMIVVLDASETVPEGMEAFDPDAMDATVSNTVPA